MYDVDCCRTIHGYLVDSVGPTIFLSGKSMSQIFVTADESDFRQTSHVAFISEKN